MKPLIYLSLLILLLGAGCRNDVHEIDIDDSLVYPFKLVKEKEVLLDSTGYPVFVKLDSSENILIRLEDKDSTFLTFDQDLVLKKERILKYGEGPNECFLPIAMGGDEDNLIIYDVPVQRHYIFDGEMKCKKRLKAKGLGMHWPPHGAGFSSKHNRMLMAFQDMLPDWGAELRIYLRELEGDDFDNTEIFKAKFYTRTPNGNFAIVGKRYFFNLIDDFVYILDKAEYRIKKIDMEGSTVKEIKVKNFPVKRFTMREREDWVNKYGPFSKTTRFTYPENLWPASGILKIADGLAVLRMENYNPGDKKEWAEADYFDKELNFLGKIRLPWFLGCSSPAQISSSQSFYMKEGKLFYIEVKETEDDEEYLLSRFRIEK